MEASDVEECFTAPACAKTLSYPLGVPIWKMLSFHFWTGSSHPLGHAWTLSPEDWARVYPRSIRGESNVYLGYSVEQTCQSIDVIPAVARPNQAYVFAKTLSYFYGTQYAWPNVSFVPPYELELIAGVRNDTRFPSSLPPGIQNFGPLDKTQFYREVGQSRAIIGVGKPILSPTPYDAMCMGVPVINPVLEWKKEDPENRAHWETQHDGLKTEEPPYVYHVKKGDGQGLWDAVQQAIDNPIERYIPPAMTMEALKSRLYKIVEMDRRTQAETLLEERNKTGGMLFEI